MLDPVSFLVGGLAAWALCVLLGEQLRRRESQATCHHDEGAAFVYHSFEHQGKIWNRACWRCGKHEVHFQAAGVPRNWPPTGARLKRGESTPDLVNRPKDPV